MHGVLEKTMIARNEELARFKIEDNSTVVSGLPDAERKVALEKRAHLRLTKAAEIRIIRNVDLLKYPSVRFKAEEFTF